MPSQSKSAPFYESLRVLRSEMQWVLLKEVLLRGAPRASRKPSRRKPAAPGERDAQQLRVPEPPQGGGDPRAPGRTAGPAALPRSPGRRPGRSAGGAGRRARSAAAAAASPDLPARPGGAVSRDRPALAPRAAPEAAGVADASRSRRLRSRRPDARPGEERREVRPLGPAGRAAAAGRASGARGGRGATGAGRAAAAGQAAQAGVAAEVGASSRGTLPGPRTAPPARDARCSAAPGPRQVRGCGARPAPDAGSRHRAGAGAGVLGGGCGSSRLGAHGLSSRGRPSPSRSSFVPRPSRCGHPSPQPVRTDFAPPRGILDVSPWLAF